MSAHPGARRREFAAWLLLGCALLALLPIRAEACGPFLVEPQYVFRRRPGAPYAGYAAGDLGIVRRDFMPVFLIAAYRALAGLPLDREEQRGFLEILPQLFSDLSARDRERSAAIERWNAAAAPSGSELVIQPPGDAASESEEVGADAFDLATQTLQRLRKEAPEWVRPWALRQHELLNNEDEHAPPIAAGAPEGVQRAAAYQEAARAFHGGELDLAEQRFRAIAADAASPFRALASYLVARTLIHAAHAAGPTHPVPYGEDWTGYDPALLARAEAQLQLVLADRGAASVHAAAWKALSLARTNRDPEAWHGELLQHLARPGTGAAFGELAHDAQIYPRWGDPDRPRPSPAPARSDLEAWLRVFEEGGMPAADAKAEATARWREQKTLPWLVAAVAATPIEEPLDEEIRSAALAVPQASPAWPTISFALVQRWIHDQKFAEARARLHLVLEGSAPLRPSTRNAFAQLRGQIPETYAETLRDGLYVPAGYDDEEGPGLYVETTAADAPPWLADEGSATRLAATIPARKLVELAARPEWPRRTRRQILLAAWSRAVIVNALPTARDAAAQLIRAEPSLAPELQTWLAEPEGSQRFAAIALMLRWPGASPYLEPEWERAHLNTLGALESSWATNWWCERPLRPRVDYVLAPRPALAAMAPEAATAEEIAANAREWTLLQAAGNAPDFFAREVLAWDAAHPHDPRTAEALHDVVRAARLGCRDEDTPALTGKAFRALHQHFPKSRWAAQTPIWQ